MLNNKIYQVCEGEEQPSLFSVKMTNGNIIRIELAEDIRPVELTIGKGEFSKVKSVFRWNQTIISNIRISGYDSLVSYLVRLKYSQDDVEAIILNNDPAILLELNTWRKEVKDFAKTIFS